MGDVADIYELSPLQQGMLFHALSAPGAGVDIEQIIVTLHESLDVATFEQAWRDVMQALNTQLPSYRKWARKRDIVDDLGLGEWVTHIRDVETGNRFGLEERLEQRRAGYPLLPDDVPPRCIYRSKEFAGQLRDACHGSFDELDSRVVGART
jgi:hypothetical protein